MTTSTSTASTAATDPPDPARRAAAVAALALVAAAAVIAALGLRGDFVLLLAAPLLVLVTTATAWVAVTHRGTTRYAAGAGTVVLIALLVAVVVTARGLLTVVALLSASTVLVRYALERERRAIEAQPVPGARVGPARKGVLIVNLHSGGGKVERFGVVDECRRRGIEAIVLRPGDDLRELARQAIDGGADVIGMAGGDGSQALVASAATAADVPLVCVPAGTRNHFAVDLGLDRDDVLAALDAFDDGALERRIDLAEVNDRLFVNNVSLGVYASIVQSPAYRNAKRKTTASMLADLVGPDAAPFDLHLLGPDGAPREDDRIIQISNNPYVLDSATGFGGRARLDTGQLGIAAAEVRGALDVTAFVAAEWMHQLDRFDGWTVWTTDQLSVDSGGLIDAAVDGEAMRLDPPLAFRILPGALRVRIPASAPGYAPAALKAPSPLWTLTALVRAAAGRSTPMP